MDTKSFSRWAKEKFDLACTTFQGGKNQQDYTFILRYILVLLHDKYCLNARTIGRISLSDWLLRGGDSSIFSVDGYSATLDNADKVDIQFYTEQIRPIVYNPAVYCVTDQYGRSSDDEMLLLTVNGLPLLAKHTKREIDRLKAKYETASYDNWMKNGWNDRSCEERSTPTASITKVGYFLHVVNPDLCAKANVNKALNNLKEKHPPKADAEFPSQIDYQGDVKALREKWLVMRDRNRAQQLSDCEFKRSKSIPCVQMIRKACEKRSWKCTIFITRFVSSTYIKKKPTLHVRSPSLSKSFCKEAIVTRIKKQNWPGLVIAKCGTKGQGVKTRRQFHRGSVVCNYHGDLYCSKNVCEHIHQQKDNVYSYFFKFNQKHYMIDANCPCTCHGSSFGRIINHSTRNKNLIGRPFEYNDNGENTVTILFYATKNILFDEELFYDYGVRRYDDQTPLEWATS